MNKKRKLNIAANEISKIKSFNLNGYEQKVLIEGKSKKLPIIICLHGGPGSPLPFSVGSRGMFPELTNKFIMVYWDQLGCGINKYKIDNTFTIEKFVGMTISLIKEIKSLFPNNKLFIFAVSWGSILSANAISIIPKLIDGVIVYGQMLKALTFSEETFAALKTISVSTKTEKQIAELMNKEQFSKKDLLIMNNLVKKYTDGYQNRNGKPASIGKIIMGVLTSPDYTFLDFVATINNSYAKNESLLYELTSIDLSHSLGNVQKPYYIMQGDTDIITSTKIISEFVKTTQNDNLHCEIIKDSGHVPSAKVVNIIMNKFVSLSKR